MKHLIELDASRLTLVGADAHLLRADLCGREALAAAVDATVPSTWPPEHHDQNVIAWALRTLDGVAADAPWRLFYMRLVSSRTLVGTCGFKGLPDTNGGVEVGYSILTEHRGKGLATEAVKTLIEAAFSHGALTVAAETYPSLPASIRVMQKSGMRAQGPGADPGSLRYSISR